MGSSQDECASQTAIADMTTPQVFALCAQVCYHWKNPRAESRLVARAVEGLLVGILEGEGGRGDVLQPVQQFLPLFLRLRRGILKGHRALHCIFRSRRLDFDSIVGVGGQIIQREAGSLLDLSVRRVVLHCCNDGADAALCSDSDLVGIVGGQIPQRVAGCLLDLRVSRVPLQCCNDGADAALCSDFDLIVGVAGQIPQRLAGCLLDLRVSRVPLQCCNDGADAALCSD
jgi:hypothetical protein